MHAEFKAKRTRWRHGLLLVLAALTLPAAAELTSPDRAALQAAIDNPARSAAYRARDGYRHPQQTLTFFQVRADSRVVEITPGGGWYSEILAHYLAPAGEFYAAHFSRNAEAAFFRRSRAAFIERVESEPELFRRIAVTEFDPVGGASAGPAGSVDAVLTFRNVHNWIKAGFAEAAFRDFHRLLKPGGILGVVEHRARPGTSETLMIESGYVTEARVIELAQQAGFEFEARSDINANPADTTDHPRGVWTLPPSLRLGEQERDKYLGIGESDRMTLRFRKPMSGDNG